MSDQSHNPLEQTVNSESQKPNKHRSPWRHVLTATYVAAVLAIPVYAAQVTGLKIFQAGEPAKAADVNGNFSIIADAVNDNHTRISALETAISDFRSRLTTLESKGEITPKIITVGNYTVPSNKTLYIYTMFNSGGSGQSVQLRLNGVEAWNFAGDRVSYSLGSPMILASGTVIASNGTILITGIEK